MHRDLRFLAYQEDPKVELTIVHKYDYDYTHAIIAVITALFVLFTVAFWSGAPVRYKRMDACRAAGGVYVDRLSKCMLEIKQPEFDPKPLPVNPPAKCPPRFFVCPRT